MLGGLVQPALPVGQRAGEEVPLGILVGGGAEQLLGPAQIPHVDGLADLVVQAGALGGGAVGLLIAALIASTLVAAAGAHLGDGVVGLVDLLHLLLRQIGQRVVLIVVGMVLPGQFPVRPLDLVVAGVGLYTQYAVRIAHVCFLLSV